MTFGVVLGVSSPYLYMRQLGDIKTPAMKERDLPDVAAWVKKYSISETNLHRYCSFGLSSFAEND